jgi:ABC-2 type transport system ATP-binding protein
LEPALSLSGIEFAYGKGAAIRGVSLCLRPGDCYGFLGHNGAGKTTVMRLALGLLRPQRGSVRIFGVDAIADPVAARRGVGALIERPGFYLGVDAIHNLTVLARLQGMGRRAAAAEAAHALELVGLAAAAGRDVGTFSLGMRQRLGIAQALLGRPRLLLLDEPTGGLDPEGIADLRDLLRQLTTEAGVAVLVSSHQLAELDGLCNRIGVLREGAMVVEGDLASLRSQLSSHYVVAGNPSAAVDRGLAELGLVGARDGDACRVDLGSRAPGEVARALTAVADLTTFAPEAVSLEQIYLRADELHTAAPAAVAADAAPPVPSLPPAGPPAPLAAFAHELRVLRIQRGTWLLALPCLAALWSTWTYRSAVQHNLARVGRGELFSADAGSGFAAAAAAMQSSLPLLAACVLWLASQSIAADHAAETLRNTLLRPVRRGHVLFGKFAALAAVTAFGWFTCIGTAAVAAWTTFGFGDLEDVSKHGDRQTLADARDVAPVLWSAIGHVLPALLAFAAVGLAFSAVVRRPARAIILSLAFLVGLEAFRSTLRWRAGWLLTSHLPTGLRDDSAVGYLAAVARGAADAHWQYGPHSPWAAAGWLVGGFCVAWWAVRRMRVS